MKSKTAADSRSSLGFTPRRFSVARAEESSAPLRWSVFAAAATLQRVIAGAGEATEEPREEAPELDTQGLARAAKGGDEARFGQLYERIAPAIYTWACVRIRPAMRGQLDPQDIVQEVWCRAWKAFPHFDPDEQPFRL